MFILDTDASNTGFGGIPNTRWRRESQTRELSSNHFYKYLHGRQFLLRVDHAAVKWLINFITLKNKLTEGSSGCRNMTDTGHGPRNSHYNADGFSSMQSSELSSWQKNIAGRRAETSSQGDKDIDGLVAIRIETFLPRYGCYSDFVKWLG